jgi:ADP-heptose:LPS heptosyltransferase
MNDAGRNLTVATAATDAQAAAEAVLRAWRQRQPYPRAAVALLCELAAADDEAVAREGALALFQGLVERLNDSFDPRACDYYDRLFTQVIEFSRRLPAARRLDAALRQFGLPDAEALLARKRRVSGLAPYASSRTINQVILLSRVTLGADVAVTSVLLAALRQRFPAAEFVLLGSPKLRELFGGAARVRELAYERGGKLAARLNSWLDVVAAVDGESAGCAADELLVIDPDSRLTQLGLLPVCASEQSYFFFESRSYGHPAATSLAQLSAQWCAERFGADPQVFPALALPERVQAFGQAVGQRLRRANRPLLCLSFGVGGNENKRVGEEFEAQLLQHLVKHATLILDKGGNAAEREQINRLLEPLRAQGYAVAEINAQTAGEAPSMPADILTWDGSIGAFAGLIAASDQYIGYDSAGQHLAAALGVPTLAVFVNANSPLFAERWRPYGKGLIEVIKLDAAQLSGQLAQTLSACQRLLR